MMTKRLLAFLLSVVMLVGVIPMSAGLAYEEEEECVEIPIPVTAEGKTYSLFTEQYLDDLHGMSFLYVIRADGRFYTPAHPGAVGDYKAFDSVPAVDITAYWDEETNTFSDIPDSAGVGVMQYQSYPFPSYGGQALYLDGGIMFSLSVPFEDDGSTWFGSIDYYDRDETYSYSRALWNATGGGSGYFYEAYYDWYNDGGNVYGVLALKGDRFAMRNFSEEFNALEDGEEPMFDVGGYLYAAPCTHVAPEYSEYVAPTCMDKGCKEYWYCVYCGGYFADEACTDEYGHKPVLPALDHIYGDTACNHCGREIPVYTRITSYDQFTAIEPGASFIAVAEIDDGNGGLEYYVLKQPLNIVGSDIDEDGVWDILLIDEDQNGVSDVLEQDLDGDGIADAMRVDGFWSEETLDGVLDEMEIEQYLFELEMEYTGGYMPGSSLLDAIPVTPDAAGGITVKNMGALEFVMERVIPDDKLDEQYYGDGATKKDYENDFIFRVPNFWIRPMVMVDNHFYQMPYEEGDSRVWGVLFGDDVKALGDAYFDETFPDDAVVMYTEPFYSLNNDGELAHALRFLVNGDEKHFWMTSYSYWEETVGTEIPIYLYCSDAGEGWHEHIYGPWSKQNDETHVRYCTVDGCTEYDIGGHHVDSESERTPDTDNPELGHWVACTDCGENIHEYHTREEYNYRYDMWRDAEDGVHHYVNCEECGGVAVYEEHDWGEWSWSGIWNSETQEYDYMHRRSCECFPCPGEDWRVECIYDEGVVTTEPTCTEPGVITYTCIVSGCTMETRTYTEEIPAIGHAWGEWEPTDIANVEQRVCANDPTHVEQRELVHEHVLGDLNYGYPATFVEDGVIDHYRCGGCEAYFDANKEEVDSIVIPKLSTDLSVCVNGIPVSLLLTEQDENMLVWTLEGLSVTQGDVITVCQTDDTEITYSYFAGGDGNNVDTEGKILTTASSADVMLTWTPNGLMLSVSGYKYPGIVIEINGVQYPMHFVTYLDGETTSYIFGYVELFAGDRLVVVDNVNDLVYGYDDIAASSAWNTWDYHRGENGEIVVDFATRYGIEFDRMGEKEIDLTKVFAPFDGDSYEVVFGNQDLNIYMDEEYYEYGTDAYKEALWYVLHEKVTNNEDIASYVEEHGYYFYTAEVEFAAGDTFHIKNYTAFEVIGADHLAEVYADGAVVEKDGDYVKILASGTYSITYIPAVDCIAVGTVAPAPDKADIYMYLDGNFIPLTIDENQCAIYENLETTTATNIMFTDSSYTKYLPIILSEDTDSSCAHVLQYGGMSLLFFDKAGTYDLHYNVQTGVLTVVPSNAHAHVWDEGKVTTEPTHTESGVKTYTCTVCGDVRTEEIPTTPEHEWSDWKANGNGGHNRYCNCGEMESEQCVWDEGKVTTEPTHTESGVKTYTCTVCGDVRTEEIPTTPEHEWSDWKANGNGGHNRYCNCGESESEQCVWDEGKVTVEPTHTESGVKTYTCTVCGDVRTEEIPTTPEHEWSDWKANGNGGHNRYCNCGEMESEQCVWDEGKVTTEPTYDAEGIKTYTCTVCGDVRTEPIDKLESVDEIVLPENEDIKVTVPDGSDAILDADTELKAEQMTEALPDETKQNVIEAIEILGGDKAEVLATYDISLLLNGVSVQPGGVIEVTLPIPALPTVYDTFAVVYIDEQGNVTPCETRVNGDGTLTFVTEHFSRYAIVGADPLFVYGDANGDGVLDGRDVVGLLQYLANYDYRTGESSEEIGAGADCNGDGVLDGRDCVRLLRYLASRDPLTGESDVVLG